MLKAADTDGSGEIDYTEFLAATMDPKIFLREDYLKTAFKMFDQDGSGKIDAHEIALICKGQNSKSNDEVEQICKRAILEVDKNGDGQIDFDEFVLMMKLTNSKACSQTTKSSDTSSNDA